MDIDQARYILRELYNELRSEYPDLRWYTTEHGSVSFAIPNGDKENTILAAISVSYPIGGRKYKRVINNIYVLRPGCTKIEDAFFMDNILGSLSIDEFNRLNPSDEDIKNEIKEFLKQCL